MMAVGEEEAAAASVEGPSREKWLMLDFFWRKTMGPWQWRSLCLWSGVGVAIDDDV